MNRRRVVTWLLMALLVGGSVLGVARGAPAEPRAQGGAPAGLSADDWQNIVAQIRERPYRLVPAAAGGYRAANPVQGWRVAFDADGAAVQPSGGEWTWRLRLLAYGYPGSERSVSAPLGLTAAGNRVDYTWDDNLTEWWHNGPDGVKQTFVLARRPGPMETAGPLAITVGVGGHLQARLAEAGQAVTFADARGDLRLRYRALVVTDAAGRRVPAWFEATEDRVRLRVDDREARYPLTVDPVAQQAYLKASNPDAGDQFGTSVAISGDTVVVGAPNEASGDTGVNGDQTDNSAAQAGAAYVFVRSGGVWSQQAYLKASNTNTGDFFGSSVAISGDTVVVGAVGEASNATGVNGDQADNSVPLAGAVYVFIRSGTVWSQQAYLKASNTDAEDRFGVSVAISGDTVVVGANTESSGATGVNGDQADNSATFAGAAYVFIRSGTVWSQQAYLKASNTRAGDFFGISVAAAGDTVVVGAPFEASGATGVNGNQADHSAVNAGAAYVFVRSGGVWSQQAYLKASNTDAGDVFGFSVAIAGDTVVVGAPNEASAATGVNGNQADNSAAGAGAAYVFIRSGTDWSQQAYLKASNTDTNDDFGVSVAVAGDTVVVGTDGEDSAATGVDGNQADNSAAGAGAAYVFGRSGTDWTQRAYLKASNTDAGDFFGFSVAVAGDTVVAGAYNEASGATGVNGDQADNSAPAAGAAYVFPVGKTLQIAKTGSGRGTVTSAPAGIDCGPTCATNFLTGSTVTLTGAPAPGSVVREFSGGGCSGAEPCAVSLTAPTTVTVTFAGDLVNVAVNRSQFTSGTTLRLAFSVNNPTNLPVAANFLTGVLLPDGDTIVFITGSGVALGRFSDPTTYQPIATGVSLAQLVLTVPDFIVYTWTGGEPHGSYVFFLAAVETLTGNILGVSTATTVLGP